MMKSQLSFGNWLAQRRKVLDLTQEELAKRVGCSTALIRKIEANERKPSKQIVELLADVFGITPDRRNQFSQFARAEANSDALTLATAGQFEPNKPRHSNLVSQPNILLGREWEVATLRNRLLRDDVRLVTLIGPPGIGKTRLSIETAQLLLDEFPDGVYFVSLTYLTDPRLIATTIAHVLDITLMPNMPTSTTLINALRNKQMLLVMDNFEHVLPAASLIAELLAECVWLKALVTSREPLHLRFERQFTVQALALPPHASTDLETLAKYAAVRLFIERAQATQATFELTPHNAPSVCEICNRLEGLPLAIELAASWVHLLACNEIAIEIKQSLDFLSATIQDIPERHRSLSAAFDHSWHLLTRQEQSVLCGLSIFRGGFTRQAAEQVTGATLAILSSLVAKSLLLRNSVGRYDLHEFVRQYAAKKLSEETGGSHSVDGRAHAVHFLELAVQSEPELTGPNQVAWMDQLEQDLNNFRAALDWAHDHDEGEIGMRMAAALKVFWASRDHSHEGRRQLAMQLALPSSQVKTRTRALALNRAGALAYEESDYESATRLLDEVLTIPDALYDKHLMAEAMHWLAGVAILQADYTKARTVIEQALALAQSSKNSQDVAGWLIGLADVHRFQGEYVQACTHYEEGIRITRLINGTNLLGYALRQFGKVNLDLGDLKQAEMLCRESLHLNQQAGSKQGTLACIASLAFVIAARGELQRGVELMGAASALLAQISTPLLPSDRIDYDRHIASLRAQLGEVAFAEAWAKGQAMTLEQSIAYVITQGV